MYQIDWTRTTTIADRTSHRRSRVVPNVWYLGFTSLLTDVSSEMVSSVLPAYLVLYRGLSPFEFGTVDSVYQGAGAVVRWLGGSVADRWHHYKRVAAVGYALSAVSKIGLLIAGNRSAWITTVIAIDRAGKGLRTAPRDALISLSSDSRDLGTAFGVHRALDAAGALLGPLVAVTLLRLTPNGFDNIFVVSFAIACVGLAIILLFVDDLKRGPEVGPQPLRRIVIAFRPDVKLRTTFIGACILTVATIGDGFVYLALQRTAGFGAAAFPLFAFMTAAAYMLAAVPAGRLADRVGRRHVFMGGHLILLGSTRCYLIEGTVDQRTARVVATGIECRSPSPDGRRRIQETGNSP